MKSYASVSEFSRLGCVMLYIRKCPATMCLQGKRPRIPLLMRWHLGAYLWKERSS